ncbi:MAG: lysine transporter LysE [Chitinophagaceae bacterium]|nr:MAG: lysine transporter LysE [Chitinophagaceae bacterium]
MAKLLRIFVSGVFISFIGMLPLGTQNVAAMQIAISDGLQPALLFALGLVVADIFYIYITLLAMRWIQKQKKIFKALEWVTLLIVVALATANFYAAVHPTVQKNVVLSNPVPRFVLGLVLNSLNPMQIPFWFGWGTVLLTKKIIEPKWRHYHFFTAGATIGMSAATLLFIFGGRIIADKINNNQDIVYFIIGGIFTITAIIQIWKMVKKKDAEHKIEHPEEITAGLEHTIEELNKDDEH